MSGDKIVIPPAEFAERRRRAADGARRLGLDALLVGGRGGGTLDRYGDVMYLTNHYTSFPYIPDLPGSWTGRAHAFLVLPVGGRPTLVIDVPYVDELALPRDEIVIADLVIEDTIAALKAAGLEGAKIGLVGGDTIPHSMFQQFAAALPKATWVNADAVLADLRSIKSPAEIAKLKAASALGSRMLDAMMDAAKPGASHGDVVAAGLARLVPAGGMLYNSFMASGRGGDDPTYIRSSFPTWGATSRLENGQWFRIGISGVLDGYCFDLARARPIGPPTNAQISAFEAAISVIETGIATVRPGATAGEIGRAGRAKQDALGYPFKGVFSALGHGVGLGWDPPWLAPDDATVIRPNMVLCLEKTLMKDGYLGDFEETVVVTESGCETITNARKRYW